MTFDALLEAVGRVAPQLVAWVTDDMKPGLRACSDQLADVAGASEAIAALDVPVLFWNGADDPNHDPMQRWARDHGREFLSVPGGHYAARYEQAAASVQGLRAFLDRHVR